MSTSRTLCSRGACHLACVARAHGHTTAAFTTSAAVSSKSAGDSVWQAMTNQRRDDVKSQKSSPQSNRLGNDLDTIMMPAKPRSTSQPPRKSPSISKHSHLPGSARHRANRSSGPGEKGWNPAFDGFLDPPQGHQAEKKVFSARKRSQRPGPRESYPDPHLTGSARGNVQDEEDWSRYENPFRAEVSAFDLFNEVVKKDGSNADPERESRVLSERKAEAALEAGWSLPKDAHRRMTYFLEEVWPHVQASRSPPPPTLFKPLNLFLSQISRELTSRIEPGSGTCLKLAETYDSIGKYDLRQRTGLILILCNAIMRLQKQQEPDQLKHTQLMDELIKMWMAASQMIRTSERGQGLRWALPALSDAKRLIDHAHSKESQGTAKWPLEIGVWSSIFNQFPTSHARYAIPGLLMTLVTLSHESVSPRQLGQAAPLLELSRVVFQQCPARKENVHHFFNTEDVMFVSTPSELSALVIDQWPTVETLLANPQHWRQHIQVGGKRKGAGASSLAYFHKALRSAHASNNTGVAVSIWLKLQSALVNNPTLEAEMRSDPEFLDFWHFVWCSTQRADMLNETQKLMKEIGLEPTIKTFTAMMHGWKLSRDGDKIEALWDSLANSSIKLDIPAWTERISGLIELGHPERGIEVLAEMVTNWKAAVNAGKSDQAVQPTIEVVNAAFKPLIRMDKKAAHDVLTWAGRQGIYPDVLTYNILLQESLKHPESSEDVQVLLKGMKDSGIEPDAATFTIILEEALGRLHHATSEEQVTAINQIMEDIKLAGVKPNLETYGKMLHAVASLSNGSDEAVETVLENMRSSGHSQISPHMVLILINRVVKRGTRYAPIIEDLLHKHGFKSIKQGDQRLWENVLRVYATLGDSSRAMSLYDELRAAGRTVTSQFVLRDILVELIEKEEMDFAKRIVADVLADLQDQEVDQRRWKSHFWHQAYKFSLLSWDNAPAGLKKQLDERRYREESEKA